MFKNPVTENFNVQKAWQVVDQLGFRGKQIGQAQVSQLHSNFIVNLGGARASDVLTLITEIEHAAQTQLGLTLQREVKTDPVRELHFTGEAL